MLLKRRKRLLTLFSLVHVNLFRFTFASGRLRLWLFRCQRRKCVPYLFWHFPSTVERKAAGHDAGNGNMARVSFIPTYWFGGEDFLIVLVIDVNWSVLSPPRVLTTPVKVMYINFTLFLRSEVLQTKCFPATTTISMIFLRPPGPFVRVLCRAVEPEEATGGCPPARSGLWKVGHKARLQLKARAKSELVHKTDRQKEAAGCGSRQPKDRILFQTVSIILHELKIGPSACSI